MPKKREKQKEEGLRDENGVRLQNYNRFKSGVDYQPIEPSAMTAMIDLEIERHKRIGRPPKFQSIEELSDAILGYWEYLKENIANGAEIIPDTEGLASFIGVSRDTLHEWERSNYRGFSDTIKTAKNSIGAINKQLAKQGKIPAVVFAIDFNNNHGYTQKQEVVLTPSRPLGEQLQPKELSERYAELPED